MTIQEMYEQISERLPKVIYLTGKTCTGKTTFSNRLQSTLGYQVVGLDKIVHQTIVAPFNLQQIEGDVFVSVYKTADNSQWNELFVAGSRKRIEALLAQGARVIIDGAVPNVDVVRNLLEGLPDMAFVYFHPAPSSTDYLRNLAARFRDTTADHRNGLPNAFWEHIDQASFAQFCQDRVITPELQDAIADYAKHSTEESVGRVDAFRNAFPNVEVVEI